MAKLQSELYTGYENILVETYLEGSKIRVRPLPNQGYETSANVQCERAIRKEYPAGQVFRAWVTWIVPQERKSFLRAKDFTLIKSAA